MPWWVVTIISEKHFPWWVGELWVIKIKLISYTVFLVTIILFIFLIQGEQLLLVYCNLSDQQTYCFQGC